ncbi:nardilysin-like [Hetaerina americana]|uniref:nardilysin-like n=1 Tax=Hetaerina americana TaxID=62018 RepID=UPI003A7F29C2
MQREGKQARGRARHYTVRRSPGAIAHLLLPLQSQHLGQPGKEGRMDTDDEDEEEGEEGLNLDDEDEDSGDEDVEEDCDLVLSDEDDYFDDGDEEEEVDCCDEEVDSIRLRPRARRRLLKHDLGTIALCLHSPYAKKRSLVPRSSI